LIEAKTDANSCRVELQANLINFLLSSAIMVSLVFIPLLSTDLGASDLVVGIIGAAYGMAYLFSSLFFGWKSDTLGRLVFIRAGLLTSSLAFLAQTMAFNLVALTIIRAGVGFTLGISSAALIAYIYESHGNVGKFSSYGSLGWIFSAAAAAILIKYNTLFTLSAVLSITAFFISLTMSESAAPEKRITPQLFKVMRRNAGVYLAFFFRHLGAAATWVILPLFFTSIGADKSWIGILWGINFVVQFIAMRYVERFPEKKIFITGQVLSVIVFLGYSISNNYLQVVPIQILLGLSWSFLYVGALLMVLHSGEEKGTASGVFFSTINLCGAVGPFIGGLITHLWGFHAVMIFAAAVTLIGLLPSFSTEKREMAGDKMPLSNLK
jgi:MFS family permease